MGWGAAAAAVANIAGTFIGSRQNRRRDDRQFAHNREMAEYAYSKDLEHWHRQNEYNTPQAQMERFKEGGLNPNLIYGQGTPGNAQQMPHYQAPQADYSYQPSFDPGLAIQQYQDIRQRNAQIDVSKQQVQLQKAQTDLTGIRSDGMFQENTIRAIEATIAQHIMNQDDAGALGRIANGRIGSMEADNWLRKAISEVKQWEAKLTRQNINPRDQIQWRQLIDFLDVLGFSPRHIRNLLNN